MTIKKTKRTTKPPKKYQTYMLRTCSNDYTSYNDFKYPKKGFVYAPDWDAEPVCGNGLHGLLRGEGDEVHLSEDPTAIWQVLMVDSREVVDLTDKVKVPRAWVLFSGTKEQAIAKMQELGCSLCVFGVVTAGMYGKATAGKWGKATTGYYGTATAGDNGTATAGSSGTATAGMWGTATAGYKGTASTGYKGTAIAGKGGTANTGKSGTAIAGNGGTASAGDGGKILIDYWDTKSSRYRVATGYIGEKGLLPNTRYKVDENGKFYEVK